jgi:hypothetical protein
MIRGTLKQPAWIATSHPARSLYLSLRARYNTRLQNAVYLSARDAAEELGSSKNYVGRWFRELEYYGFIRMVAPGCLGVDGMGRAPHWRLTEEFYLGQTPTRDYLNWDGEKFREQKGPQHYLRKKQNPVPQKWDSPSHKYGTVIAAHGSESAKTVPQLGDIQLQEPVPQMRDITRVQTH